MAYIIVILALGLILGPLVAAMPRPRAREIAGLRERARSLGLRVSLREPPDIPPRFGFQPPEHLACYSLARARDQGEVQPRGLFVRTDDGWQTREVGGSIPALTAEFPDGVVIVAAGWDEVQAFWDERGGEAALDAIHRSLRAWL